MWELWLDLDLPIGVWKLSMWLGYESTLGLGSRSHAVWGERRQGYSDSSRWHRGEAFKILMTGPSESFLLWVCWYWVIVLIAPSHHKGSWLRCPTVPLALFNAPSYWLNWRTPIWILAFLYLTSVCCALVAVLSSSSAYPSSVLHHVLLRMSNGCIPRIFTVLMQEWCPSCVVQASQGALHWALDNFYKPGKTQE